jgi:dCTP deaminase
VILSDGEIRQAIRENKIHIDPLPEEQQYTTSALDLVLGDEIKELKSIHELQREEPIGVQRPLIIDLSTIDIHTLLEKYAKPVQMESDGSYLLPPDKFVLGITREYIDLPRKSKIAARVEGRSTLARLGLVIHLTAPTIHADFRGRIVLEMRNFGNYDLRLRPGKLHVCQLIFERLGKIPQGPARTKFIGQTELGKPTQPAPRH